MNTGVTSRHPAARLALAAALLAACGCQQKMAQQPYFRPLEQSEFFADGRAMRPVEEGVVLRGQWLDDSPMSSGLTARGRREKGAGGDKGDPSNPGTPLPGAPDDVANYVDAYPFAVSEGDLRRGMDRYGIYCTPCHGPEGDGNGKIPERGYLKPPSLLTDNSRGFDRWRKTVHLRDVPAGYIYEVVTRGYGGMPAYAAQIPADDRWRITAYIKALQLSRYAVVKDLPADVKAAAERKLGGGQ